MPEAVVTDGVKGISTGEMFPHACIRKVGIVYTSWNTRVITSLVSGAISELLRQGVLSENIQLTKVPGAFELPYAARTLQLNCNHDVIMCIGCLIKGETMHFEYISEGVAQGLMRLNTAGQGPAEGLIGAPVIFGVLECLNEEQALARAGLIAGSHNHGVEWAQSALRMADVYRGPLVLTTGLGYLKSMAASAATGSE